MNQFDNEEHTLPKGKFLTDSDRLTNIATLNQLIKESLPESIRMSQQSSDLIIQLTMHFLNYLSDTSNNACSAEGKKTITPGHVAKALKVITLLT